MIDGYLPVARVKEILSQTRIQVTVAGDGLSLLKLPATLLARSGEPDASEEDLNIAVQRVILRQHRKAELRTEPLQEQPIPGSTLFARRSDIEADLLLADLTTRPLHDGQSVRGRVVDCLETGTQQVLVARLHDETEVLIPFVDRWVQIQPDRILVPELDSLIL